MVLDSSDASSVLYLNWFILGHLYIQVSLGRALDNRDSIETFVLRYKSIQPFKLSKDEWDAAAMISMDHSSCNNIHWNWLNAFILYTVYDWVYCIPFYSCKSALSIYQISYPYPEPDRRAAWVFASLKLKALAEGGGSVGDGCRTRQSSGSSVPPMSRIWDGETCRSGSTSMFFRYWCYALSQKIECQSTV